MKLYCVKCHKKQEVEEVEETTVNDRRAAKAKCPECGTQMFRFLPKAKPQDDRTATTT